MLLHSGLPSLHTTNGVHKGLETGLDLGAGQEAQGGVWRGQLGNVVPRHHHGDHDFVHVTRDGDPNDLRKHITQPLQR